MDQRFTTRRVRSKSREALWGVTHILLGLRYSAAVAQQLLRGVMSMKESATYQAILQEGMAEGEARGEARGEAQGRLRESREVLIELGSPHLGPPDAPTLEIIAAITELARLRDLRHRVQLATSWAELLGMPPAPPARRRGRRSS